MAASAFAAKIVLVKLKKTFSQNVETKSPFHNFLDNCEVLAEETSIN